MGITLKVTAKGQVTLRKEVLEHLGARPGDRLEVDFLPSGRVQVRAKPSRDISSLFGQLKRPGQRPLTVDEMNDAVIGGAAEDR